MFTRLQDIAAVKIGNPRAHFWMKRRGTEARVGRVVTVVDTSDAGSADPWREPAPLRDGSVAALPEYDIGVEVTDSGFEPSFVKWFVRYLQGTAGWFWATGRTYGTLNLKHIRLSDVRRIQVPALPHTAQKQIVGVLEHFEADREAQMGKLRRQLDATEKTVNEVLVRVFGPVRQARARG